MAGWRDVSPSPPQRRAILLDAEIRCGTMQPALPRSLSMPHKILNGGQPRAVHADFAVSVTEGRMDEPHLPLRAVVTGRLPAAERRPGQEQEAPIIQGVG